MSNYNTLFDSDLAEHDFIMRQPIKSPKTCAECAFSMTECEDIECDFCRQFDKTERRCRCTTVQAGERCKFYERRNKCQTVNESTATTAAAWHGFKPSRRNGGSSLGFGGGGGSRDIRRYTWSIF